MAADPIKLRQDVIDTRKAFYRNECSLEYLHAVVDQYLDACETKHRQKWPTKKFRRPSRSYILRAL